MLCVSHKWQLIIGDQILSYADSPHTESGEDRSICGEIMDAHIYARSCSGQVRSKSLLTLHARRGGENFLLNSTILVQAASTSFAHFPSTTRSATATYTSTNPSLNDKIQFFLYTIFAKDWGNGSIMLCVSQDSNKDSATSQPSAESHEAK